MARSDAADERGEMLPGRGLCLREREGMVVLSSMGFFAVGCTRHVRVSGGYTVGCEGWNTRPNSCFVLSRQCYKRSKSSPTRSPAHTLQRRRPSYAACPAAPPSSSDSDSRPSASKLLHLDTQRRAPASACQSKRFGLCFSSSWRYSMPPIGLEGPSGRTKSQPSNGSVAMSFGRAASIALRPPSSSTKAPSPPSSSSSSNPAANAPNESRIHLSGAVGPA